MKGKLIVCFVIILMTISVFGNIVTIKSKAVEISKKTNSDLQTIEQKLNEQLPSEIPKDEEIKIQKPTCIKESGFVYEPPWSKCWWSKEKEIYGLCDAWQEGSHADGKYARTRIQTWAGGAGWTFIKVWLCQGFYFYPPKTTTYSIEITHSAEGILSGSTYGVQPGAASRSCLYFYFMTGIDNYESIELYDEMSYFGGPGYSEKFDEEMTKTYKLELKEGEKYWIGTQTKLVGWCEGLGLSYSSTDSKTTGDHSRLKKIVINFDNDPPSDPEIRGMTSGNPGTSYAYGFSSIDPEHRDVSFILDWGDGRQYQTDFVDSGRVLYEPHTWSTTGTYNIKAKAVDQDGVESDWSTYVVTMPKSKACQILHLLPYQLLQRIKAL